MSNSKLKKIKYGIKNGTKITLKLSSNVLGNFLHKLLLINTKDLRFRKDFTNNSAANIKLTKTQLRRIGGFFSRLLGPLLKSGLPLMKNGLKPLAKGVLKQLGLTATVSATDAAIHKKISGSGNTKVIISNEQMNDIMKMVQ